MRVLALDTATEILSVAVADVIPQGDADKDAAIAGATEEAADFTVQDLYSVVQDEGLRHSEGLLPTIGALLERSPWSFEDIELIAVSLGPGSFTGLRIGLATAKGLAMATTIPLVQVDNLAVYASLYSTFDGAVLPVIDAKKRQFYAAVYAGGSTIVEPCDASPRDIAAATERIEHVLVTGPHAPLFLERLSAECESESDRRFTLDPDHRRGIAAGMLVAAVRRYHAEGAASNDCAPRYLRLSDAERSLRRG